MFKMNNHIQECKTINNSNSHAQAFKMKNYVQMNSHVQDFKTINNETKW